MFVDSEEEQVCVSTAQNAVADLNEKLFFSSVWENGRILNPHHSL